MNYIIIIVGPCNFTYTILRPLYTCPSTPVPPLSCTPVFSMAQSPLILPLKPKHIFAYNYGYGQPTEPLNINHCLLQFFFVVYELRLIRYQLDIATAESSML